MRFIAFFALMTFGFSVTAEKPNVLFIISDDLSAEALGVYGNAQCTTPNIDRLAREGVRFTRTYCQFPICGPSRAALMSGLYPEVVQVMRNSDSEKFESVMGNRPSMAEHFRLNGYYTARTSKIYHMRVPGDITAGVDGPDHVESWSEKHNFKAPEWMTKGEHEHLSNEKLRFEPETHYSLGFGSAFYVVKGESDGFEQPDVRATSKAIEIMSEHKDDPFFMAVGLVRPHVPLVAPTSYFDAHPHEQMQLPVKVAFDWDDLPKAGISRSSRSLGMQGDLVKQRKSLAAYYASVSFMDAQVGRLLDALDELELRDNTIVVFMSDHGYHLGEHDFWQKVSLHEESMRIPLIISVPGVAPATATTLSEQIDIYPTLAELAGLDIPEHVQGRSLVSALSDPDVSLREDVYGVTGRGKMLRTVDWAYIRYSNGEEELYDMINDPQQFTNAAPNSQNSDALELMRQRMDKREASVRNAKLP
ncbi:MAG: sulfatase [Candidatus Hydrogenedentota bacterium]